MAGIQVENSLLPVTELMGLALFLAAVGAQRGIGSGFERSVGGAELAGLRIELDVLQDCAREAPVGPGTQRVPHLIQKVRSPLSPKARTAQDSAISRGS